MLYEHNDPAFLIRHARHLIETARHATDPQARDRILNEASRVTAEAERIIKGKAPVVILAEVA